MSRFNRWAIEDIKRVLNFLAAAEGTDFATKEFTKKDFDKAFEGTRKNPAPFNLEWLKRYGEQNGRVTFCPRSENKYFHPFIIVARTEDFELPYKEMPWGGYQRTEVVKNANGEIIDVNINAFKTDTNYRKYIDSQYGECTIVSEEKKTFTAHRNFYRVDLDALNSIKSCISGVQEYYEEKLEKARRAVEKYENTLALVR